MSGSSFNNTDSSNLFKTKYGPKCRDVYNAKNATTRRIKRDTGWTGQELKMAVSLGFNGGVSSGDLPETGNEDTGAPTLTSKSVYGQCKIKREAIKASKNDAGAFVRGLKHVVKKTVESFMRNDSRIFFGDGSGELGVIDSVVDNGGGNYTLTFAAGYNEANFEENDRVNIETGNTDLFSVDLVDPQADGTLDVTVTRETGTQVPAATDQVFMQKSEDNDPQGLKGALDATSGTLYSVTVGRRWQAEQDDAGGATIDADQMNNIMIEIERKTGLTPKHITSSHTQFTKILNFLEDRKRYPLPPRYGSKELKGQLSFSSLSFESVDGKVPIVSERFCDQDRLYFLRPDEITRYHRPGGVEWFDEDGTVFLREANEDFYTARYGGYYENFIVPTFQGRIDNLAT